jgi:hypothetical protein
VGGEGVMMLRRIQAILQEYAEDAEANPENQSRRKTTIHVR